MPLDKKPISLSDTRRVFPEVLQSPKGTILVASLLQRQLKAKMKDLSDMPTLEAIQAERQLAREDMIGRDA